MSVNTIKCVNCNIVICELLSFIQNKIDVMDNESLIRICVSAFNEEDVVSAKDLLFSALKTNQKKISRRKEGKKQRDLEDIICVFKVTEPDLMPIFVARDLQKLPPVTFDHVDVTKLLKDLLIVRAEINDIKGNYATVRQLDELKTELVCSRLPASLLTCNVNTNKRGGYLLDSGPFGLPPVDNTAMTRRSSSERAESPKYRSLAHTYTEGDKFSAHAPVNSTVLESEICTAIESTVCHAEIKPDNLIKQTMKPTMAETVRNGKWRPISKPTDEWITVQNRRSRNRFAGKMGKAVTDFSEKFKAADLKVPLFISNVNKETEVEDICQYIKKKTEEIVSLEKITMKKEKPYNAYKLLVNKNKLETFLDDRMWPDGITFRRFIHFKNGKEDRNNIISGRDGINNTSNE